MHSTNHLSFSHRLIPAWFRHRPSEVDVGVFPIPENLQTHSRQLLASSQFQEMRSNSAKLGGEMSGKCCMLPETTSERQGEIRNILILELEPLFVAATVQHSHCHGVSSFGIYLLLVFDLF